MIYIQLTEIYAAVFCELKAQFFTLCTKLYLCYRFIFLSINIGILLYNYICFGEIVSIKGILNADKSHVLLFPSQQKLKILVKDNSPV